MRVRLLLLVAAAAGLAGIGVSIYLTVVHFSASALVCSVSGVVNCERVLGSAYGSIAGTGIPTSASGILWFAVSAGVALLRLRSPAGVLGWLHLAWAAAGLLTVFYLVFVEVDRLGAICAWCTAAHVLVLVTFICVLTLTSYGAAAPARARR